MRPSGGRNRTLQFRLSRLARLAGLRRLCGLLRLRAGVLPRREPGRGAGRLCLRRQRLLPALLLRIGLLRVVLLTGAGAADPGPPAVRGRARVPGRGPGVLALGRGPGVRAPGRVRTDPEPAAARKAAAPVPADRESAARTGPAGRAAGPVVPASAVRGAAAGCRPPSTALAAAGRVRSPRRSARTG